MATICAGLLDSEQFAARAAAFARDSALSTGAVVAEAEKHFAEMAATYDRRVNELWQRVSRWVTRGYDVLVDEDKLAQLRRLDRNHSLIFLTSHRSYLDQFVLFPALAAGGLSPVFGFAGGNLDFFPFGTLARRNGLMHVRRSTTDAPVYRFALREMIGHLVANRVNLCWSIEGGRTRTGKLRPPRYGLLRYVADATGAAANSEPLLVPVSVVYDQLPIHEVTRMTSEARGAEKEAENLRWLIRYAAGLKERRGRVYLDFGNPLDLRERLVQLPAEGVGASRVERVALDVCHRINAVTPITPTAAVCIALLAADRALTLDEVLATVRPLADYIQARDWPVAGAASLTDRSTLRWALRELVRSGVLREYRGGAETVYRIGPDQHLVAAFYRNSVVQALLLRAIAELALLAVREGRAAGPDGVLAEAMALRGLLKFDFFFAGRDAFAAELATELGLLAGAAMTTSTDISPDQAELWLAKAQLRVAPLVLRPFLDAYRVVADRLVDLGDEPLLDPDQLVRDGLGVGHQWALQRTLASEESVSGEMFRTALKLAAHRGLLNSGADLKARRLAFMNEVNDVAQAIARLGAA
jgi:glycerol-3-phosphate O-acyltransferase